MRKPISTYRLGQITGLGHQRITYAVDKGFIPISRKLGKCRWWSREEIRLVCNYFGIEMPDLAPAPESQSSS